MSLFLSFAPIASENEKSAFYEAVERIAAGARPSQWPMPRAAAIAHFGR